MKKKSNSWIAAGLFTIVATITTLYCLLEFRSSVLAVGISSLFLLASALWLFLCIAKLQKRDSAPSGVEEQPDCLNDDGASSQGEELIRLANTFGKGTYVYTKRSADHLEALLKQMIENQQAQEALIQTFIQEQTKVAKFQVKYGQADTAKVISTLSANCLQINRNVEKCMETFASLQSKSNSSSNTDITVALADLSKELACINNSIQALQVQLATSVQQPVMYASVQPQPVVMPAVAKPASADTISKADVPDTTPSISDIPVVSKERMDFTEESVNLTESGISEETMKLEELIAVTEEPDISEEPTITDESTNPEELTTETESPVISEEFVITEETMNLEELIADTEQSAISEESAFTEETMNLEELIVATEQPIVSEESATTDEAINLDELIATTEVPVTSEDSIAEESTSTETTSTATAIPADSNKQLSPEEIAALFAALS